MSKCKHRTSWILMPNAVSTEGIEWCYSCGAFRRLKSVFGSSCLTPNSIWHIPVKERENPWFEYDKKNKAYLKRVTTRRKRRYETS